GWLLTGLPLASDASGRMTTVRIFLGSVAAFAPCPGATGAGSTTRGVAWVPKSLLATGSSCFDTTFSLSGFADRSCATLIDCGSPAPAGNVFFRVGVAGGVTRGGRGRLGLGKKVGLGVGAGVPETRATSHDDG